MKKASLIFKVFMAVCFVWLAEVVFAPGKVVADKPSVDAGYPSCTVTPLMNQEFFPVLLRAVDEAQDEILIAVFAFKTGGHATSRPDRLLEHLAQAAARGVDVKIILENAADPADSISRQNTKTKNLLEKRGVKVYMDSPSRTTHTKLVVVDQRLVFIGSHNFTASALKHNNEMSVMIEKSDLAKNVRHYMLTLIKEAQ